MPTIREITDTIEQGEALKSIASVYTEIASLKIKKIREQVFKTRAFFTEVSSIYAVVKELSGKSSRATRQQKTASILITSNDRFYGHIDTELIEFFLNQELKGDVFVVGRGGKQALEVRKFTPLRPFIFKKDIPETEELINLVTRLEPYSQILVYFSEFKTIMQQVPTVRDITQSQTKIYKEAAKSELARTQTSYIFEPEAVKILAFFDSQIKRVLIDQTFLEAELARIASRLIFMDQAQHNADDFVAEENKLLYRAKRSLKNARILEIVASMKHTVTI